jgi:hypothetical protein
VGKAALAATAGGPTTTALAHARGACCLRRIAPPSRCRMPLFWQGMGALTPGQGAPSSDLRQVRRMVLPCPWACRIFAGACARSMLPAPNCTAIKVPHAVVLAGHGCTNSGARRSQQRPAAGKTGRLPWACKMFAGGTRWRLAGRLPPHSVSSTGKSAGQNYCAQSSARNRIGCRCYCCSIVCFPPPAPCKMMKLTTRQVQLAAVPKLLPPPGMSRGIQFTAARKVQGRMLARLGQRDGRVLVSSFAVVHTALGDMHRVQHPWRLAECLPPHSSSVPRVNRPGGATAHKAARGIASVAAATAARSCDSPRPLPAPDR